ncbi:MAG: LUD domain-containing protein [Methanomassiliicoccales archaeon]|jgi:iron-sulfur cluster protein
MTDEPNFCAGKANSIIRRAIDDYARFEGMRRAFQTNFDNQEINKLRIDGFEQRRERARAVRQRSFSDNSLLKKAITRLEANGIRVRIASTKDEALNMILEEIGNEKLIVKSKSNVTKEIDLTHFLESKGIEVVETDAGDRIVQLAKERTVHPTGPALHLTRYDVAQILSDHLNRPVEPNPDELTEAIRKEIATFISRASIGITGANFIAAEEGSIVLVHNEGNITACARRPKKHIVVSAVEKIVPNLDEAMNFAKLQILYGTGSLNSSFIDVISAPSRTADIEKIMFYGMHGPKEVVLILIDNGRSSIEDKEVMYCINCGSCLLKCPVYDVLGPSFGGHAYLGGRGVCFTAELEGLEKGIEGGLTYCTQCGLCAEMCPVKIDTPRLMRDMRYRAVQKGLLPTPEQEEMISNVRQWGNPWNEPPENRTQWSDGLDITINGPVLFFAGCFNSLRAPEIPRAAVDILVSAGLNVSYLGADEVCCGSPFLKIGARDVFMKLALKNASRMKKTGARRIITSCPGCYNTLSSYSQYIPGFDLKVEHISQTIVSFLRDGILELRMQPMHVTYHDPCDLGRHRGIFEEPRTILNAIPGLKLTEMRFNRNKSICCGAGAGVKKTHPELASFIGKRRIDQAIETGADCLITTCAFCENNFRDALKSSNKGIEIIDLVTLVKELSIFS